jgi:hyperosmotically inducible protein
MRNLKRLVLVGGASAVLAITALTGCEMFRGGSDSDDRTAGRQLDDKHITANIEKKLKTEPVYKFSDVDVKTFAGVVQLSGFVSNEEQKNRAGNLAQQVEGVSRVVNNITLKPNTPLEPTGRTNLLNQPVRSNP